MVWFPELELEETMLPHGEWAVVSSGAPPTEEQAKKVIMHTTPRIGTRRPLEAGSFVVSLSF
jgi:hypothetical protein